MKDSSFITTSFRILLVVAFLLSLAIIYRLRLEPSACDFAGSDNYSLDPVSRLEFPYQASSIAAHFEQASTIRQQLLRVDSPASLSRPLQPRLPEELHREGGTYISLLRKYNLQAQSSASSRAKISGHIEDYNRCKEQTLGMKDREIDNLSESCQALRKEYLRSKALEEARQADLDRYQQQTESRREKLKSEIESLGQQLRVREQQASTSICAGNCQFKLGELKRQLQQTESQIQQRQRQARTKRSQLKDEQQLMQQLQSKSSKMQSLKRQLSDWRSSSHSQSELLYQQTSEFKGAKRIMIQNIQKRILKISAISRLENDPEQKRALQEKKELLKKELLVLVNQFKQELIKEAGMSSQKEVLYESQIAEAEREVESLQAKLAEMAQARKAAARCEARIVQLEKGRQNIQAKIKEVSQLIRLKESSSSQREEAKAKARAAEKSLQELEQERKDRLYELKFELAQAHTEVLLQERMVQEQERKLAASMERWVSDRMSICLKDLDLAESIARSLRPEQRGDQLRRQWQRVVGILKRVE